MADDKGGGGGGSEWGPLEIILVILLLIGLLDRISGKKWEIGKSNQKTTHTVAQTKPVSTCGLALSTPNANQKIRNNLITVSGFAGTCDWKATESVALYAQVVDGKGVPLTEYLTISRLSSTVKGKAYFDQTITLTRIPNTTTGYLILIPAVNSRSGSHTESLRIPLVFSK